MRRALPTLLAASALAAAVLGSTVSCKSDPGGQPLVHQITSASELIGGREAAGRVGDWLLSNGRVRFIVQDAGSATGWGIYGGSLVDLDRVPAEGRPGDDRLQEIFMQCDLRAFAPEKAEVIADGRDGKPAILRFTGHDRGIPLIDAAFATSDLGLDVTLDYVLAPGSDTLELVLRARDTTRLPRDLTCGLVLIRGDGYEGFAGGPGFGPVPGGELDYVAAAAPDGAASYALYVKDAPLVPQLTEGEITPMSAGAASLRGGDTLEKHLFVSVGTGDVESALAERRRVLDPAAKHAPEVRVTVAAPPGLPVAPSAVVLTFLDTGRTRGDQTVTSARPVAGTATSTASGVAKAELPAGHYRALASFEGRSVGEIAIDVPAASTAGVEASMTIASLGALAVDTERLDKAGASLGPTAAKLVLVAGHGASPNGPAVLERYVRPMDTVVAPAGDYTAFVSHGPEDELDRQDVTIAAGKKAALHAKVRRVVDTRGWVSADLHVHSTKSVDADAPRPMRVLGAVAEGLEILVSTDHDIVTDYGPFIRELGFERVLRTVNGTEVSPAYGHINGMPLPVESPEAYWRVKWYRYNDDHSFDRVLDPADIVAMLRGLAVDYVQINHPRSGQGVFNYIGLDADTTESRLAFPAADGFEILNSRGGGPFEEVLHDFVSLLRHDKRLTVTGVSDAHETYDGVGWARTMIATDEEDLSKIDVHALFTTLRQGHAIALSGPMVTLEARHGHEAARIGDTLASPAGSAVQLHVHVEAPSWMDVSSYRLLENGEERFVGAIGPGDASSADPVVRFDHTFTSTPSKDSFYFVVVEGAQGSRNEPVIHARARTVTNPIFVDTNGDGFSFTGR